MCRKRRWQITSSKFPKKEQKSQSSLRKIDMLTHPKDQGLQNTQKTNKQKKKKKKKRQSQRYQPLMRFREGWNPF